jgi:glycosyl transferase family 25
MFIFEDDCIVDWRYIEHLARTDWARQGLPYIRLFAKIPAKFRVLRRAYPTKYHSTIEYLDYSLGTQGYLITQHGANMLLDHCREIRRPIDREMDRAWVHGVRNIAFVPFPVLELSVSSSIGEKRLDSGRISFAHQFGWTGHRVLEKLRRIAFALFSRKPTLS